MTQAKKFLLATAPLLLGSSLVATPVAAMDNGTSSSVPNQTQTQINRPATTGTATTGVPASTNEQSNKNDAQELIRNALAEVRSMEKDPQLKQALTKAKGIYLVPDFGRGALVVGGRGGAGVVLAHVNGQWTDPVFYDFGAISVGAQAGASGGPVAFLLMSQGAVDQFKSGNKISLNAESGFTIVNYSANAQASWGKGDIIFWSNTKGAYAGATVSLTDLNFADGNNRAYYGTKIDPAKVLGGGTAQNASAANAPEASQLKEALPG